MLQAAIAPIYEEIFPFWEEISADTQEYICRHSSAVTYAKGTVIHDGSECSGVLQEITFDVMIDAEEDTECYVISGPAFASVSERNPKVKIFSLETAISRFSDVMWVMQQILFMKMDQRLAIFLSDESSRIGSDVIPLTHEQIARYMGSAREVVTRMLKYFANDGIVEVSRKGVKLLDKKRLWELTL